MRNYPTNKIVYNHIDGIWSIALADMRDYKTSNNRGNRYIFIKNDKFSNYTWAIPPKNKNSQSITKEFSNTITTSKGSPLQLKSDRGREWYNSSFQKFFKSKNVQHYSRFTDKRPNMTEKVVRNKRNLIKKRILPKGNADWISKLPSIVKHYIFTIHESTEIKPIDASKKSNET